jgi:hypothetical protein
MRRVVVVAVCVAVLVGITITPVVAASSKYGEELAAFGILEELAEHEQDARVRNGYMQLVAAGLAGAVWGTIVYAVLPEPLYAYAVVSGVLVAGVCAVPGIVTLTRPTPAEVAFESVSGYPEDERERHSVEALYDLADLAHRQRVMKAIRHGATGIASLALGWPYTGVYNLGMVGYTLYFPSSVEQALARYERLAQVPESE